MNKDNKILIVDDKKENFIVMNSILKCLNADIYEAQNGNDALNLCLHNEFAVILLDVKMPVMDGYEVARILKKDKKTKNIPIIFITAEDITHENIFKGYEVGGIDYITKPVISEILLNKVKIFLDLNDYNTSIFNQQELKYKTLFESINDAIIISEFIKDGNAKIIELNYAACKYFDVSKKDLSDLYISDMILEKKDLVLFEKYIDKLVIFGSLSFENEINTISGNKITIDINCKIIEFDTNKYILTVIRDITEKKKMHEDLINSRDYYLSLLESAPAMIWRAGIDTRCNYFNKEWLKFTGRPIEKELGDGWAEGIHPEDLEKLIQTYIDSFNKRNPFEMEYRLKYCEGDYRWIVDYGRPFYDIDGKFAGYIGYCFDITHKKNIENELKESEARYRRLIENIPDNVYSFSSVKGGLYFSLQFETVLGYSVDKFYNDHEFWNSIIHEDDQAIRIKAWGNALCGKNMEIEYRILDSKGKIHWFYERSICIKKDNEEMIIEGIASDITKRKEYEYEINQSLKEKIILLQEVHHRVKNNLQIITSLLALQKEYFADKNIMNAYQESEDRIRVMALVHEILYQSKNFDKINLKQYLETLLLNLYSSYGINSNVIEKEILIEDISLNINCANPIGLIINEIISNSFKYAFPHGRKGKIFIHFSRIDELNYALVIGDNGIGFDNNIKLDERKSLGMQLIDGLIFQIKAQYSLESKNGVIYKIIFNPTAIY